MNLPRLILACRLTSIVAHLGCAVMLWLAAPGIGIHGDARLVVPTLFLSSAFYTYWSQAVMIESTALLCNLAFLACWMRGWFFVVPVFGAMAAMVKANAFPSFAVAGCAFAAWHFHQLRPIGTIADGCIVFGCLLAGRAWLAYGDSIKRRHPLSRHTQLANSAVQRLWNFGTLRDRLDRGMWMQILSHAEPITGISAAAWIGLTLGAACSGNVRAIQAAACVALWLSGPAIFFRVTYLHTYYQCATGVFLLVAIGLLIVGVHEAGHPWHASAALGGMMALGWWRWWRQYRPGQLAVSNQLDGIVKAIQQQCGEEQVIVTCGLDWDCTLLLYCQRRGLMLPNWPEIGPDTMREAVGNLAAHGYTVGALVLNGDAPNGITREMVYDELRAKGLVKG